MRERIIKKLTDILKPLYLEVIDESHKHKGHLEASSNAETHFKIKIKYSYNLKKNLVERHRYIYYILTEEFESGIHALSIEEIKP